MRTLSFLMMGSAAVLFGCGSQSQFGIDGGDGPDAGEGDDGEVIFVPSEASDSPGCVNLECQIPSCSNGDGTSITGTVYAPDGKLPLYGAIVYVPNSTPTAFTAGVACDKCGAAVSGNPVVVGLSDAKGAFKLTGTPAGNMIPLVIQLGKWRKQIVIPEVKACQETKLTDANQTRLPKKQSEGDMPRVAVTTGGCDKLSCILPKMGIDTSEFGSVNLGGAAKRAFTFYGSSYGSEPFSATPASNFWNDFNQLKMYDYAIFSCECSESPGTKGPTAYAAVQKYLDAGGRIFTTDFQYTWYKYSPDANMQKTSDYPGGAPTGAQPFLIDTTFPKGKALADWMKHVSTLSAFPGLSGLVYGEISIVYPAGYPFANMHTYDKKLATSYANSISQPRYLTINTPVGKPPDQQCGKGIHLDAHITQSDTVDSSYPAGCTSPLQQPELSTIFFLFDVAGCIQKETDPLLAPKPAPH